MEVDQVVSEVIPVVPQETSVAPVVAASENGEDSLRVCTAHRLPVDQYVLPCPCTPDDLNH